MTPRSWRVTDAHREWQPKDDVRRAGRTHLVVDRRAGGGDDTRRAMHARGVANQRGGTCAAVRRHVLADQRGAALVIALLIAMVLGALAAVLVAIVTTETALSASFRHAREVAYGAESALDLAIHDLATTADWSTVLAAPPANRTSTLSGASMSPTAPDGRVLDLVALTSARQRESDARDGPSRFGANSPQWRLYLHAQAADLLPAPHPSMPVYLIAWVADDGLDGDGDPLVDSNQTIVVHAEAYGSSASRRVVESVITRRNGVVHIVTWRD
jgi:hypothetical protein